MLTSILNNAGIQAAVMSVNAVMIALRLLITVRPKRSNRASNFWARAAFALWVFAESLPASISFPKLIRMGMRTLT